MPPVYEPEVGAAAIVFAAYARRREVWVGGSTVSAILGSALAPGLLDRLLARDAYSGQMSSEHLPPGQADNLFTPAPGDPGAHGRFDAGARRRSALLWASRHRAALVFATLFGAAALAVSALTERSGRSAARRDLVA